MCIPYKYVDNEFTIFFLGQMFVDRGLEITVVLAGH